MSEQQNAAEEIADDLDELGHELRSVFDKAVRTIAPVTFAGPVAQLFDRRLHAHLTELNAILATMGVATDDRALPGRAERGLGHRRRRLRQCWGPAVRALPAGPREGLTVSEYDVPGLTAAAPAFTGTAESAEAAARAIIRLRAKQHGSKARLPVDLTGLDARLRAWADEVGRSADLLRRTAAEVGDADRRAALELSAATGAVPRAGAADRPAGVGLGPGDSGAAVTALQRRLAAAGFDPGAADGKFGPRTAATLTAFQRAQGLDPTGRTDLETATALLNAPARALPSTPEGTNGRLPSSDLTGVGDGRRMYTPAARAFGSMDDAARAAGHELHVNSGYRTYGEQAALYEAYRNGTGNLAAAPGRSTHGLGLSADIRVTDPATLRWLRANAGRYGFVNDVPSEAWHWTWRP